jgi:endonuclease/exonuclease/phosphatase family metal-dependent hydrolase
MAKAFSVASWNVEHFGKDPSKVAGVVGYLASQKADIVALYEVEGREVFRALVAAMPKYQFHITEGEQTQEILVGIRQGFSAWVTQKLEFQSGQSTLRPGVLVTVSLAGESYPLLFLHLKSMTDPKGFGLRDDMIERACSFRTTLDKAAGGAGKANYLFVGDLNTMGLEYPYDRDITPALELQRLGGRAAHSQMRVLTKNQPHTWWNGPASSLPPSNLDHVVAAKHLTFKSSQGAEVDVRGWPQLPTDAEKAAWIAQHSDHGLLYFEVQKV